MHVFFHQIQHSRGQIHREKMSVKQYITKMTDFILYIYRNEKKLHHVAVNSVENTSFLYFAVNFNPRKREREEPFYSKMVKAFNQIFSSNAVFHNNQTLSFLIRF